VSYNLSGRKYRFKMCLQVLQLQMNDYRYHYMFTTFVSMVF